MPDYDLSKIDPEAFEWLDYAEECFKHDGSFNYGIDRHTPKRKNQTYESIDEELSQIEAMYEASSDNVVEPLMALEQDGETVGFYMERFDGEHVLEYFEDRKGTQEEHQEIINKVSDFVDTMKREGLVHGDLANNVLYDGEEIKIIDPVGKPHSKEAFEELRDLDEGAVSILEGKSPFVWD